MSFTKILAESLFLFIDNNSPALEKTRSQGTADTGILRTCEAKIMQI